MATTRRWCRTNTTMKKKKNEYCSNKIWKWQKLICMLSMMCQLIGLFIRSICWWTKKRRSRRQTFIDIFRARNSRNSNRYSYTHRCVWILAADVYRIYTIIASTATTSSLTLTHLTVDSEHILIYVLYFVRFASIIGDNLFIAMLRGVGSRPCPSNLWTIFFDNLLFK